MAIDDKLFRIYEEAFSSTFKNRSDLARAVSIKRLVEFSYERQGIRQYLTWSTIQEYVGLLVDYDLLTQDLKPTILSEKISRRGFEFTLAEKVELYAVQHGFSPDRIRAAVSELIKRQPAQLPTPPTVFTVLQLGVGYNAFHKALSVRAFQQRVSITSKLKSVLIIPDILRE